MSQDAASSSALSLSLMDESLRSIRIALETISYQHEQPTLRDRFAMAAVIPDDEGFSRQRAAEHMGMACPPPEDFEPLVAFWDQFDAMRRYEKADAMMKARAK